MMQVEKENYLQLKETSNHSICVIWLALFLVLNGIMLSMGIIKIHDCPIQPKIPLYMIVAGVIGIISKLLPLINRKLHWRIMDVLVSVTYLFDFIWVILGSVWIYSIFKPNFNPHGGLYCDETTYLMAFALVTLHWIFLAVFLVIALCCCCCVCSSSEKL